MKFNSTVELHYTFTEQTRCVGYSEKYDEYFYDEDDYEYDYTVDEEDIVDAFMAAFGTPNSSLEDNIKSVVENIYTDDLIKDFLDEYKASSIEDAIIEVEKELMDKKLPVNSYNLLDYITGFNVSECVFCDDNLREIVEDYFYDDAYEDFCENR
jgi:hypothetical protein